jgi:CRP-like cAMP-binding protein
MEAGPLNAGDIFGEDSLHNQAPYQYDVIAQGSVSCLAISRDSIEQLCGPIVEIVARGAGGAASNTDVQKEISSMTERLTIEGYFFHSGSDAIFPSWFKVLCFQSRSC